MHFLAPVQFQNAQTNNNGFLSIFTFVICVEKRKESPENIDSFDIKWDFTFSRMENDTWIPKTLMLTIFKCLHFIITYDITKCFDVGKFTCSINYSTIFAFLTIFDTELTRQGSKRHQKL